MKPDLLTIPQFCEATNIGRTVAYRLIGENQVQAVKLGKKTLVPRKAMEDFISSLPSYKSPDRGV